MKLAVPLLAMWWIAGICFSGPPSDLLFPAVSSLPPKEEVINQADSLTYGLSVDPRDHQYQELSDARGLFVGFDTLSGSRRVTMQHINGVPEGRCIVWSQEGKVLSVLHFRQGERDGLYFSRGAESLAGPVGTAIYKYGSIESGRYVSLHQEERLTLTVENYAITLVETSDHLPFNGDLTVRLNDEPILLTVVDGEPTVYKQQEKALNGMIPGWQYVPVFFEGTLQDVRVRPDAYRVIVGDDHVRLPGKLLEGNLVARVGSTDLPMDQVREIVDELPRADWTCSELALNGLPIIQVYTEDGFLLLELMVGISNEWLLVSVSPSLSYDTCDKSVIGKVWDLLMSQNPIREAFSPFLKPQ